MASESFSTKTKLFAISLPHEHWRRVNGYDHYWVSSAGRVASTAFKSIRIMKPGKASHGYLTVSLWARNKGASHCVHNLVADAFILKSKKLPDVDHINRIRTDNRLENLRRATRRDNRGGPNAKTYQLLGPGGPVIVRNLSGFCRENDLNRASMGGVVSGLMESHKGWRSSQ